ncbi:MAG: 3-keto-5-aminohexanoate cleavage protein, partial [Candidatus Puniceispirillaceae bacterium]
IFKIAGHLSGLDGAVLPQTANYYEDIQARFGLASEVLEQLKAGNILYDEDEEGQFYHFYCHLEQTNMFFEFVQRIEGYKGFGAANAPFRLAAQRRLARRRNLSKAS